jgi:hypothetical protein
MNKRPDNLERLLSTAASHRSAPQEIPLGLETRVLAEWKASLQGEFFSLDTIALLRRFLLCSLALGAMLGTIRYAVINSDDLVENVADSSLLTSID